MRGVSVQAMMKLIAKGRFGKPVRIKEGERTIQYLDKRIVAAYKPQRGGRGNKFTQTPENVI